MSVPDATPHLLCCACGAIRAESLWTYWQSDEEGDHWIPSPPGSEDPMARCPACGWEHRDDESGPGMYGPDALDELLQERERLLYRWGEGAFDATEYRPAALL